MDHPEDILDSIVDQCGDRIVSSVCDIVRIRSVAGDPGVGAPFGTGPAEALLKVLEIAGSLDFRTVNLDNYAGYAEYGEGEDYIAVLGHLDTVPEGSGWTHPPFGAEIIDGRIYGRGALDDKGPVIAALFGLKALKESGLFIGKKVRIIFGTDEETGSLDMHHYLSQEPSPVSGFTPDAEFPVVFAEKGIFWIEFSGHYQEVPNKSLQVVSISGGTAVNMVPDFASAVVETDRPDDIVGACHVFAKNSGFFITAEAHRNRVTIQCRGLAAHGSKPDLGTNAIMRLIACIGTLTSGSEGIWSIIKFFNTSIGLDYSGKSFGLDISDEISGPLTLNVGSVDASAGLFRLTIDIRYPVTVLPETVTGRITDTLAGTGVLAETKKHDPPLYFPPDSWIVRILRTAYKDFTGDSAAPVAIGGGTYARRLPNIVAFGPYRPGERPPIHMPDEFVSCTDLLWYAKIYARAIYYLAKNE